MRLDKLNPGDAFTYRGKQWLLTDRTWGRWFGCVRLEDGIFCNHFEESEVEPGGELNVRKGGSCWVDTLKPGDKFRWIGEEMILTNVTDGNGVFGVAYLGDGHMRNLHGHVTITRIHETEESRDG